MEKVDKMVKNNKYALVSTALVFLALILAACGQAQQGTLSEQDTKFMKEAASGGMMEVELGKMVVAKATNDQVRQFGQSMVTDHSKANDSLKQLAANKGFELPEELDQKHKETMEKLAKLSGREFDCEYMAEMVKDHEKDVESFGSYAENGNDADVKAFAADTLKVLEHHLEMAKATHQQVCGSSQ